MKTLFPKSNVPIKLSVMKNFMHFMEEAILHGYVTNFLYKEQGTITDQEHNYTAADLQVHRIYFFEGEQSADDSVNLYLLETKDGKKGTLVHVQTADAPILNLPARQRADNDYAE